MILVEVTDKVWVDLVTGALDARFIQAFYILTLWERLLCKAELVVIQVLEFLSKALCKYHFAL